MIKLLIVLLLALPILPRYEQPLHVVFVRTTPLTETQETQLREAVYDALWYWKQQDHKIPNEVIFHPVQYEKQIILGLLDKPNTLYFIEGYSDGRYDGHGRVHMADYWGGMPLAAMIAHELGHSLYHYPDRYPFFTLEERYTDTSCRSDIMCNPIRAYLDSLSVYLPVVY